jgi:hypothetical protein
VCACTLPHPLLYNEPHTLQVACTTDFKELDRRYDSGCSRVGTSVATCLELVTLLCSSTGCSGAVAEVVEESEQCKLQRVHTVHFVALEPAARSITTHLLQLKLRFVSRAHLKNKIYCYSDELAVCSTRSILLGVNGSCGFFTDESLADTAACSIWRTLFAVNKHTTTTATLLHSSVFLTYISPRRNSSFACFVSSCKG